MAKSIFVDEDHNGNAIKNVAAGVADSDVAIISQLRDVVDNAVGGLTVIDPGAGLVGDTDTTPGTNILAVGAGAHVVVDADTVGVDTESLATDSTFITNLTENTTFQEQIVSLSGGGVVAGKALTGTKDEVTGVVTLDVNPGTHVVIETEPALPLRRGQAPRAADTKVGVDVESLAGDPALGTGLVTNQTFVENLTTELTTNETFVTELTQNEAFNEYVTNVAGGAVTAGDGLGSVSTNDPDDGSVTLSVTAAPDGHVVVDATGVAVDVESLAADPALGTGIVNNETFVTELTQNDVFNEHITNVAGDSVKAGDGLASDTTTVEGENTLSVVAKTGGHVLVDVDGVAVDVDGVGKDSVFVDSLTTNNEFITDLTANVTFREEIANIVVAQDAITVAPGKGIGVVEDPGGVFTVSATYKDVDMPVAGTDAASKAYVDQIASGMVPLAAVRAATTEPVVLTGGLTAVDGVTLADGDRILVKDQTNAVENGIYTVTGGVAARAEDADATGDLRVGSTVFVTEGATNANASLAVSAIGTGVESHPWDPDLDASVWVGTSKIAGYKAGDGIALAGDVFSADVDGMTLGLAGASPEKKIAVVLDPVGGLEATAAGLRVKGSGETAPEGEVITAARTVTGTVTAAGTGSETLPFIHNLGVANPVVSVQVGGCDVTVDVCRPTVNEVTIGLGHATAGTEFTVTVTG